MFLDLWSQDQKTEYCSGSQVFLFFYLPNKSFLCKYKLQRLQDNFTSDFIQHCFKIGNVTRPEILVLWLSQIWKLWKAVLARTVCFGYYEVPWGFLLKIIPYFSIKARKPMNFWSCDGHNTRKFSKINELSLNLS